MGEELLISCDNQEEWDDFLEKNPKVVVSFITSNSPSRELIQNMKGLAQEFKDIKFLQVDVNNFKPKQPSSSSSLGATPDPATNFTVTEVPSVMFVMGTKRQFNTFSDLNAEKLKKKITDLVALTQAAA